MIDLKTATRQEVFDYVVTNLYEQGCKSLSKDGSCAYRGPEGAKCAAGWLIPDEEYNTSLEGSGWGALVKSLKVPKNHSELVIALQEAHDLEPTEYWGDCFVRIAKEFGFNTEVLKGKDFTAKIKENG